VPRSTSRIMGQGTRLHSRIMRALHALQATKLHGQLATDFDKELMLSAGGPMVGKMWTEIPRFSSQFMDNDHFRMSMQLRLGLVMVPPGATCQISRRDDVDDKCDQKLDQPCTHPHKCKLGPARQRPHRAVNICLQKVLTRAGAEVDIERAMPSLYRVKPDGSVVEAILDAVIITPGCVDSVPFDVTIRCPHAERYGSESAPTSTTAAAAAMQGEQEKLARYGPSVQPIALETYGRMGYKSIECLRQLVSTISSTTIFTRFRSGADLMATLRCDIERTLCWNIADITLLSIGRWSRVRASARTGRRANASTGS